MKSFNEKADFQKEARAPPCCFASIKIRAGLTTLWIVPAGNEGLTASAQRQTIGVNKPDGNSPQTRTAKERFLAGFPMKLFSSFLKRGR